MTPPNSEREKKMTERVGKTVVEVIEEMRAMGAAFKAQSYEDDAGVVVAVVYADGHDAAFELLRAFEYMEQNRVPQ